MKKELVIGTGNQAKVDMVCSALAPLDMTVFGTKELNINLQIEEDGATAQENARKKSKSYASVLDKPVLSMDIGLYIDGLPDEEQPGIHTRRIPAHVGNANDEEMLAYYADLFERLGGEVGGHWDMAVCLIDGAGRIFESTLISPRKFMSQPSQKRLPGFPLASLQIEPVSGKYISEMSQVEQDAFWQRVVGAELVEFVGRALGVL